LDFKEKLAITEMCKGKTTQFQTKSSGFGGDKRDRFSEVAACKLRRQCATGTLIEVRL
jgi:hypothetical protein